jgi:uncharacterized membrane protein
MGSMKLSERLMRYVEEKLENPESMHEIRSKIIAPSLTLLKDELAKSGYDRTITTMLKSVMWPVIAMIVTILVLVLIMFNLQIVLLIKSQSRS